ncbi:MAG TPA: hypothetical protein PLU30_01180 [Verrucomicrobiae bacterium]|nr:hypothetical protein [Verrucomicrobiae bacterium]
MENGKLEKGKAPSIPFFAVWKADHVIALFGRVQTEVSGMFAFQCSVEWQYRLNYDGDLNLWRCSVENPPKRGPERKKLSNGVHVVDSPSEALACRDIHRVLWTHTGTYCLSELANAFEDALAHGTEPFFSPLLDYDPEVLRGKIRSATSFADLVGAWEWLECDHLIPGAS